MARFQRGSLRIESRKNGETWVLRYFVTRQSDGHRVEHKLAVGLVHDFPSESAAWAEVERQHLQLNEPTWHENVISSATTTATGVQACECSLPFRRDGLAGCPYWQVLTTKFTKSFYPPGPPVDSWAEGGLLCADFYQGA